MNQLVEDFTQAHAQLLQRINVLSNNVRSARLAGYSIRDIEDLMVIIKVCKYNRLDFSLDLIDEKESLETQIRAHFAFLSPEPFYALYMFLCISNTVCPCVYSPSLMHT